MQGVQLKDPTSEANKPGRQAEQIEVPIVEA
jgi:hypothetical protein